MDEARRYRTTQDMVTGELRKGILNGVLEGGQPLRQEDIAERFGVSRIPVREALRRLEGEGMVSFYPHRGAVVSELSYAEAREISEIRAALEPVAIRRAIPVLSEEDLARAEEILETIDGEEDLASRWGDLNWRFHSTLYAPAVRPRLLSLIEAQHVAFDRYIRVHLALTDYAKPQSEHRTLLELCRRGDADAAADLLVRHVEDISDVLYDYLERDGRDGAPAEERT
ncbi:MAG: GntR family transcriptional regulator [Actinomycetota bacterium]|nr:GntR family transcriptional regulator [Actinomycetota bacterium]